MTITYRDLDKLTPKESRQQKAWQNWWLGQKRLAQRKRANAQRKEELSDDHNPRPD